MGSGLWVKVGEWSGETRGLESWGRESGGGRRQAKAPECCWPLWVGAEGPRGNLFHSTQKALRSDPLPVQRLTPPSGRDHWMAEDQRACSFCPSLPSERQDDRVLRPGSSSFSAAERLCVRVQVTSTLWASVPSPLLS